jgi:hypothetical protein
MIDTRASVIVYAGFIDQDVNVVHGDFIDPMSGFGFGIGRLDPIPVGEAVQRVRAFVTSPRSGYGPYDLAAAAARRAGHFDVVGPWSLLWADALAGRVSVGDLALFTGDQRRKFAALVSAIGEGRALGDMAVVEIDAVVQLCCYGFSGWRAGAWAPKITKVAALYRPHSVPVLDGYLALAFGFEREGFSVGKGLRRDRIDRVVRALAGWIKINGRILDAIRTAVGDVAPTLDDISDVRLLDIVLWTAQDDRMDRPPAKPAGAWLSATERVPLDPEDWGPTPLD